MLGDSGVLVRVLGGAAGPGVSWWGGLGGGQGDWQLSWDHAITSPRSFSPPGARRWLSSCAPAPRVCVVGSGPAGFYTAQHLLKVPGRGMGLGVVPGWGLPAE